MATAGAWRAATLGAAALALAAFGCSVPQAGGGPTPGVATATRARPPITPTAVLEPLPPFGDCTEESGTVIPPELVEVEPAQAEAGAPIRVVGSGGYLQCGNAYNESARTFQLYWDDQPLGSIACYANRCEAVTQAPGDAMPGTHVLSAEGGSRLEIEVRRSD